MAPHKNCLLFCFLFLGFCFLLLFLLCFKKLSCLFVGLFDCFMNFKFMDSEILLSVYFFYFQLYFIFGACVILCAQRFIMFSSG
uniref:Uncharacterized protein n=1 Tax=Kalanchoe fedtschenkoi TaxID=63787 RepID=A0A7N0U1B0_KALFE